MYTIIFVGCSNSGAPKSDRIVTIKPPTLDGLAEKSYTTPSLTFTLQGECYVPDQKLEYSFDQSQWTEITNGCTAGTFSQTLKMIKGELKIYVVAKAKASPNSPEESSTPAIATVRFLTPPTATSMSLVASGKSDSTDGWAAGTQNSLELSFGAGELSSVSKKMQTTVTGTVYAQ